MIKLIFVKSDKIHLELIKITLSITKPNLLKRVNKTQNNSSPYKLFIHSEQHIM